MVEISDDTEELANIGQLLCAQDSENIDQQIYSRIILTNQYDPSLHPSNERSGLNDVANGTPTSSVNLHQ